MPSSSFLGCFLEGDQSNASFRSMYVRSWKCIIASEESLSRAVNTTFWPQKTADILSYPQRQRTKQKKEQCIPSPSRKKDPRSTPCYWQEPNSSSCNWLLSSQLDNENFRSLIKPDKCVWSTLSQSEVRLYCSHHKS